MRPAAGLHGRCPLWQLPGHGPRRQRHRPRLARFFTGLDLLPPGLVPISKWALSGPIDSTTGALVGYCAIARKP